MATPIDITNEMINNPLFSFLTDEVVATEMKLTAVTAQLAKQQLMNTHLLDRIERMTRRLDVLQDAAEITQLTLDTLADAVHSFIHISPDGGADLIEQMVLTEQAAGFTVTDLFDMPMIDEEWGPMEEDM